MEQASDFSGTNIGSMKKGTDLDIDSLIKETLAESQKAKEPESKEKEAVAEEKPLGGTRINITPAAPKVTPPVASPSTPTPQEAAPKSEMASYEATFKEYKAGDIVTGKVVKIDSTGTLVDIGYKAEGFLPPDEVINLKVGDAISVFIENLENKEGNVELSKRKAEEELAWKNAYQAYKNRKVVEARITSAVKGGLVADYQGIRGFIPASHVARKENTTLEELVGQTLPIKIIQLNRKQGKVVLSHRLAEPEKHKLDAEKLFLELEVGQVRHGKVSSLKNFGAFVDIGGIEGLIHLSELSWKRVGHPSSVLKTGQELDVFVLGVDKANHKVALGLKELMTDPWETVGDKYKVGQVIKVKVARLTKFGAFVDIDDQLEGLVHISELSTKPIRTPEEVVKPGDELEVKILKISPEEQKIGLSAKQVILDGERKEIEETKKKKEEEQKITIADALAQKEKQKTEKEVEEYKVVDVGITEESASGNTNPELNAPTT